MAFPSSRFFPKWVHSATCHPTPELMTQQEAPGHRCKAGTRDSQDLKYPKYRRREAQKRSAVFPTTPTSSVSKKRPEEGAHLTFFPRGRLP